MNLSRLEVIYYTKTFFNSSSASTIAEIEENFTTPLLTKANDYILAVERFEINLNGIPYYDGSAGELLTITIAAVDHTVLLSDTYYSLPDVINGINSLISGDINFNGVLFNLDADGYVFITYANFAINTITIPERLNYILGLETDDVNAVTGYWTSRYPRWDIGDQIDHIRLVSNLDLISDTVGQARTNIVTDVAVTSSLSQSSDGSYSYSQRQKLNYTPNERRFLNFAAPVPISRIRIFAEYVTPDGDNYYVMLPRGGSFSIKLGFYLRK